jgi:F-type H+-transporting ATPase subunit b
MEQTLQALGGILLKAIPTVLLLLILHAYLRAMLFRPIERMLQQRSELTDGARKAASDSLVAAESKAQEYEAKLREARAAVYKEMEETRRRWLADQAAQIDQARLSAGAMVRKAKDEIAAEASAARATLAQTSSTLADQIATALLAGRAR